METTTNTWTEQEWVAAIRRLASTDGTAPSRNVFMAKLGLRSRLFTKQFPRGYLELVRAAGLRTAARNLPLADDTLLCDWGEVIRKTKCSPTQAVYGARSPKRLSVSTFTCRWGKWENVPQAFLEFAAGKPEWLDVVEVLRSLPPQASASQSDHSDRLVRGIVQQRRAPVLSGLHEGGVYGNPIDFRGLRHEPVNEQGVVLLFGMLANELGFLVESVQQGFPDCEAKRRIGKHRWVRARIEFEYESRSFRDHGHAVDGCDLIVCWRHNWPECPENIEVMELSSLITRLGTAGASSD